MVMSVFKKEGICWIDYYVNGHRKRERIDPDGWLAETVVGMLQAEITACRQLKKSWTTQAILESTPSLHNPFTWYVNLHKYLISLEPTGGIEPPTY